MVYKNLIYKNTDNTAYIKHTRICLPMQEMRETWVQSWVRKIPWRRKWQHSCLGNPRDRGTWWATILGISKQLGTIWHLIATSYRSTRWVDIRTLQHN